MSDHAFTSAFTNAIAHGVTSEKEIIQKFNADPTLVAAWARGDSVPHAQLRIEIMEWLDSKSTANS